MKTYAAFALLGIMHRNEFPAMKPWAIAKLAFDLSDAMEAEELARHGRSESSDSALASSDESILTHDPPTKIAG